MLAPAPEEGTVVTLAEGEVIILPEQHQVTAGRPVIGTSIVVEPRLAHGMWFAFRRDP